MATRGKKETLSYGQGIRAVSHGEWLLLLPNGREEGSKHLVLCLWPSRTRSNGMQYRSGSEMSDVAITNIWTAQGGGGSFQP